MDYDDNHTLFFQSEHRVQEFAFAPVMDPSHSLELTVLDKDLTNNKFIVSVGRGDYQCIFDAVELGTGFP